MPTTQEISSYVTGLASATLTGAEEVYLASDEKTTVQAIADLNGSLITTIVNIGDWDMDATASVSVTHGIADYSKIRGIEVMIRPDAATSLVPLNTANNTTGVAAGLIGQTSSTTTALFRVAGEQFDNVGYDSTSFNRGFLVIRHIP